MNSRKISLALATITTIISGSVLPSHAAPSPSKGMICPTGFIGDIADGAFRCARAVRVLIGNSCPPQFPKINLRVGRDLCSKEGATIAATGELTGLNPGRDFVPSVADPEAKRKAEEKLEQGFASGRIILPALAKKRQVEVLPRIAASEREAVFANERVLIDDAGDIDDHTRVTFSIFTFPSKKQ